MKVFTSRLWPARWLLLMAVCALAMLPLDPRSSANLTNESFQDEYQEALKLAENLRAALQNGRLQDASILIKEASRLSASDDVTRAAIYNAIGNVLADETYYQLAIFQYEQALKILSGSSKSDFEHLKKALDELASQGKGIRRAKGALSADLEFIQIPDVGLLRNNPGGLRELSAALLINDGNVYLLQQQHEQAEGLYKRALQTADMPSLASLRRSVYSNLAWSAIQQGQTQEAEKLLTTALKENPSTSRVGLRKALLAVAVGLREQQKYTDAIRRFEEVIPLYQEAKDFKGLTRAKAHLAATYLVAGEPLRAHALLEKIVNSSDGMDAEVERYVHATFAQANQRLGNLETALHHFEIYLEQIDKISSHLSTEEGVLSFRETQDQYFEDFIKTAWSLAEKKKTYSIANEAIERIRARSLFNLTQARSSWNFPQAGYMGAHSLFYDGIARYRYEGIDGDVVFESKPRARKDQRASPLQTAPGVQVEEQYGECAKSTSDKKAEEAESTTKQSPPATFLEYFVLKDQTIAIVKDRDGKVSGASLPIGKSSLTDLVDTYASILDVSHRRGVKEVSLAGQTQHRDDKRSEEQLAQQLYTQLVQPVRAFLPNDLTAPVVIIPHQALWYLPFATLVPKNGTRLIDELLLTYAASEASWKLVVNRPRTINYQKARAWIVGNPVIGKENVCGRSLEFESLPGAMKEAEQIAALFGRDRAQLFTLEQADRLRFEAWYPDFGVIHLAAHGIACAGQPFQSSIMLAGVDSTRVKIDNETNILTVISDNRFPINVCGLPKDDWERPAYFAGELTASAVITRYRLNADLITLSACQTGLGAALGEGMIGFTRAFQAAGARTLVVTLWSVSDEATTDLMVDFYKEYLLHGNKAVALRNSMVATRKRYPEPRMWAAFSLFGAAE